MSKKTKKPVKRYRAIGKIQEIHWIDHNSYTNGWKNPHECEPECTCVSVGRVSFEDERYVQVSTNWFPESGAIGIVMNIVKSCITKRRTLQ